MMKKTLAESIREVLDTLFEGPAGDLQFALSDLHRESGGEPSAELAAEIAAEYNIPPEKLLAAYPEWAEKEAGKQAAPAVADPEKAAQKKKWDDMQATKQRDQERDERMAAKKAEMDAKKSAFQADHADEIAAADQYMEQFKSIPGWEVSNRLDYIGGDAEGFLISNGDIKIGIWHQVDDKSSRIYDANHPYEIHFDVSFKDHEGTWRTYTRRGIDVSSMSMGGQFGEHKKLMPPAEVIQKIEARVANSVEKGKDLVIVPGTSGIQINKSEVQSIADKIKKGGRHALMPAGMGIGWELSNKRRWQWTREAPEELKKFFGLDKLFMDQLDAD